MTTSKNLIRWELLPLPPFFGVNTSGLIEIMIDVYGKIFIKIIRAFWLNKQTELKWKAPLCIFEALLIC